MSFNEKSSSTSDVALDLNAKRRAALAEVDNAKFSFFHVKACAVAGVGFFTGESSSYFGVRGRGLEVRDLLFFNSALAFLPKY
jgi:hypothetical protein